MRTKGRFLEISPESAEAFKLDQMLNEMSGAYFVFSFVFVFYEYVVLSSRLI